MHVELTFTNKFDKLSIKDSMSSSSLKFLIKNNPEYLIEHIERLEKQLAGVSKPEIDTNPDQPFIFSLVNP